MSRNQKVEKLFNAMGEYYWPVRFEDYAPKHKNAFKLEKRDNGILIAKWHTDGEEMLWDALHHRGIGVLCNDVSQDNDIDVFILGGYGHNFVGESNIKKVGYHDLKEGEAAPPPMLAPEDRYDCEYLDGTRSVEALVNMEQTTIGVINGPGYHTEYATLCDITLIADNAVICDPHFYCGHVPGDGVQISWRRLMGDKRYAYAVLTNEYIDAEKAVYYGLANEVVPADKIYDRAVEIAEQILTTPRVVRAMTTQFLRRQKKIDIAESLRHEFGVECFASSAHGSGHESTPRWPEIVRKCGCKLRDND